jgi:cyclase
MNPLRLIARLDIKGKNLVKGIQLEGIRVIGDPHAFAKKYYEAGADELIYMDVVASLYGRNSLTEIIKKTAENIFIPMTVGGGIRTLDDVSEVLKSGADKVAINTAAIKRPEFITEIARRYGSQCAVLSIEAKKISPGRWEAYTDSGREKTGLDVVAWAKKGVELGAGEVLITSVDCEGMKKGFDLELIRAVTDAVSVPVIVSGGMGKVSHLSDALRAGQVSGIAMADILHYNRQDFSSIRAESLNLGLPVRLL